MEGGKLASNLTAYYDKKSTPVVKAYKNPEFLASSKARNIRIMCELEVRSFCYLNCMMSQCVSRKQNGDLETRVLTVSSATQFFNVTINTM